MSANSHKRTYSGASEVQNRVYRETPLKQLIRPQEYCGTGTGAKDVRESVRFGTPTDSAWRIGLLKATKVKKTVSHLRCTN